MQKKNKRPSKKKIRENKKLTTDSIAFLSKRCDEFGRLTKKMEKYPNKYSDKDREKVDNLYIELMGRMAAEKKILDQIKADILKLNNLRK